MRVDLITLFPEACEPFFRSSILGRAQQADRVKIHCHDLRAFATDKHKKVDDRPFGGGPGMVLMCEPVFAAVESIERIDKKPATRILLSPQGERLTQEVAEELAGEERLLILAGHYEGFDERIREGLQPREISIGDFVLSGGEAAAMVLIDTVVRLLPSVLGDEESIDEESFSLSLEVNDKKVRCLEYPHYTRPREFRGMEVPEILMSGDHGRIRSWRHEQALTRTQMKRPDLLSPNMKQNDPNANDSERLGEER